MRSSNIICRRGLWKIECCSQEGQAEPWSTSTPHRHTLTWLWTSMGSGPSTQGQVSMAIWFSQKLNLAHWEWNTHGTLHVGARMLKPPSFCVGFFMWSIALAATALTASPVSMIRWALSVRMICPNCSSPGGREVIL